MGVRSLQGVLWDPSKGLSIGGCDDNDGNGGHRLGDYADYRGVI